MKWNDIFFKSGKPKRLMGLIIHPRWFQTRWFSSVVECGSLYEIEANVNLWVSLKERLWGSLERCSQIVMDVVFDAVGLSWVSQWDRPHGVFHMIVDLYQVLASCSAWCWDNEASLLTSPNVNMWANRFWKPIVSLRAFTLTTASFLKVPIIAFIHAIPRLLHVTLQSKGWRI